MAYVATRSAPISSSDGSRTITLEVTQPGEEGAAHDSGTESVGRLRLRGATRTHQRVVWREDVVDNEGTGRKSSKICCIYHKPKRFDESSSEEESSDSDSDSGSNSDSSCGHGHPSHRRRTRKRLPVSPGGGDGGGALRNGEGSGGDVVHELNDSGDEANMYERVPGSTNPHPHSQPNPKPNPPSKGKKPAQSN